MGTGMFGREGRTLKNKQTNFAVLTKKVRRLKLSQSEMNGRWGAWQCIATILTLMWLKQEDLPRCWGSTWTICEIHLKRKSRETERERID